MSNRETAIKNMAKAFSLWEQRYREKGEDFMDSDKVVAATPEDLGYKRAVFFTNLLDKVRTD